LFADCCIPLAFCDPLVEKTKRREIYGGRVEGVWVYCVDRLIALSASEGLKRDVGPSGSGEEGTRQCERGKRSEAGKVAVEITGFQI